MSQLNINTIKNKRGDYGPNLVGHSTVTGDLTVTGNISGDGSGITNLPAASGNATLDSLVVSGVSTFNSDVNINGVLTYQDVTNIDSVGMITARKGIQVLADGINAVGVVTATRFSGGEIVGTSASISGISTFSNKVFIQGAGGGSSVVGVTTFGTDGGAIFSGILTSVSYNINSTEVIDSSRNLQNISTGSSTIVTLNSGINTTATSKTVVNREFLEVVSAGTSITLPASPTIGNQVNIAVGNFTDTVVLRNGSKIMGSADDLTLNTAYVNVQFVYVNTNVGWRID